MPAPATLPGIVFAHARERPTQCALEVWSPSQGVTLRVTYKELADMTCAAASFLSSSGGIQEGDRVAFLAHNTVAYVALSLGAMACGATSVNLNWRSPTATLEACCRDLGAKLLLTSQPFRQPAAEISRAIEGLKVMQMENVCAAPLAEGLPFFPLPVGEAAAIIDRELSGARDGSSLVAAVFFTGGTTGMPKAVPHTHHGLLWFAHANLQLFPEPFSERVRHAGTVCFTPYFHVMGFVANLVFNLNAGCRAALLASHDDTLSPRLLLSAVEQLRPSVVNTVPWVVEGLAAILADDDAAEHTLSRLHLVTYGGAALSSEVADSLAQHSVTVACTYGQTELAGPVMFGMPAGDPNVLRPLPGVRYELVRSEGDDEGEGELVLLGNESSTSGYLPLSSDPRKYRDLAHGATGGTRERYATGDRFATVVDPAAKQGGAWLRYLCRDDDLLVHTSGEMSNPVPTETAITGGCAAFVAAASCVGTNLPRPLLLVELADGVGEADEAMLASVRAGLAAANAKQPSYSHVLAQHVMLLPAGTLPKTVKGGVQRPKAEAQLVEEIRDLVQGSYDGPTLMSPSGGGASTSAGGSGANSAAFDSLSVASSASSTGGGRSGGPNYEFLSGLRLVLSIWVIVRHFTYPSRVAFAATHVDTPLVRTLDQAIDRAGIAVNAFIVAAGFGAQLANATSRLSGKLALRKYYFERLQRIYLTCIVITIPCHLIYSTALQRAFDPALVGTALLCVLTFDIHVSIFPPLAMGPYDFCVNAGYYMGTLWFIGVLILLFLLYPLLRMLLRRVQRAAGNGGLALSAIALYALYFAPILVASQHITYGARYFIKAFLPFNIVDFYVGMVAGTLVLAHSKPAAGSGALGSSDADPGVKKDDGAPRSDEEQGLLEMCRQECCESAAGGGGGEGGQRKHKPRRCGLLFGCNQLFRSSLARGLLADACCVGLLLFVFVYPYGSSGVPPWSEVPWQRLSYSNGTGSFISTRPGSTFAFKVDPSFANSWQDMLDTHAMTMLIALFLYGASAGGGSGLAARILGHPALSSLGGYALDIYIVAPWVSFVYKPLMGVGSYDYVFGLPFEVYFLQFGTTVLIAVAIAEWVLMPLGRRLQKRCL